MKQFTLLLLAAIIFISLPSCKKQESGFTSTACKDCMTQIGLISRQGPTTYQYGSHTLTTNNGEQYVLTSTIVDLDKRVGQKCIVLMEDLHYHAEDGPPLYNVTVIRPSL